MDDRRRHRPLLILLAVFTYICNLFELWYTLYVLDHVPNAREINPVMVRLLEQPILAVLYKYAGLPLALYILYRNRDKAVARLGIWLCALCFGGTVVYQLLSIPKWM